ncbi:MAG: inorganic phosphate transporter, partial [Armatimonadota bacterium]|nr:inorganic phosphate transporter [Armatimonadota bacterium]
GFHDAANSIATVVATKVLSPKWAVAWAAFWNFVAAFGLPIKVATTINKDIVHPETVTIFVIAAALVGAILWDIITWYFGLPTSSSHALIGGLIGASIVKSAFTLSALNFGGLYKVIIFIALAPIIGMLCGYINMVIVMWICRHRTPGKVDSLFRKLQLASAAAYSLGHGMNDAQKTMGIIWMVLISGAYLNADSQLPYWVVLACHTAIALGTLTGGWRIVKTMGLKITKLRPVGGFAAETSGAFTLIGLSWNGIPVSTTHTITGAIVGVGATTRLSAVRWGVAGRIVWAWVLTIPAAALISGVTYLALTPFIK